MPLYVYVCPACGVEVEELRPAARADDPVDCPVCNARCERGVSLFAVSSGQKEKDTTRRKPKHRPGCPCCTIRAPSTTSRSTSAATS
ncbi:MAG: FmdB family zinc ribbon protein [Anaerolineae bacterium]|nr:FmdB family zinc ribbon protein [Anaerolineae bacterium]